MYLIVAALLLFHIPSRSQCTGSLGAPIVNITFGQGGNPGTTLAAAVPGATPPILTRLPAASHRQIP